MHKKFLYVLFAAATLTGCGESEEAAFETTFETTPEEGDGFTTTPEDADISNPIGISEESLETIIHAIPSPLEMTVAIKRSGAEYNNKVISDPAFYDKYTTSHKRALNLGVYGADLGYLNMYEKTGTSLDYLKTIKQLSENLNVGQFFDFAKLKDLASNKENIDSLLLISTRNFSQMNKYLRDQKRGKVSVLVVTGTYIEGLNIAAQIVKENPESTISDRIGEQKLTVEDLITILKVYEKDPVFADLIKDFSSLKEEMDQVDIVIVKGEQKMEEIDGVLTLISQDESEVRMSPEILAKIIEKAEVIRNKIIS